MVSKGIIDATKVVRTALQDAASIAGLLMTTEAMWLRSSKRRRRLCRACRLVGAWIIKYLWNSEVRTMLRSFLSREVAVMRPAQRALQMQRDHALVLSGVEEP